MIILGLTGSVATVLATKMVAALQTIDPHVEVVVTEKAAPFYNNYDLPYSCDKFYQEHHEWTWTDKNRFIPGGIDERNNWKKEDPVLHIELGKRAHELVIAPLTANTLGKISSGICDNLLTSVVRALPPKKNVFLAPAMNTNMWQHPITRRQINTMREFGYQIVYPQNKMLACGDEGMGAMANIDDIIKSILVNRDENKWWFPLGNCSGIPVEPHPGAFAHMRRDKRHTGVDLYTEENSRVYTVESGTVICIEHFTGEWDNSPWWNNTDCVLIEGRSGVVCYGEVEAKSGLKVGDHVYPGQYIANVKRVIKMGREHPEITGWSPSMLHMELYPAGTEHPSCGFESHLQNATPFLADSYRMPEGTKPVIYDGYNPK